MPKSTTDYSVAMDLKKKQEGTALSGFIWLMTGAISGLVLRQ
jgi:hypothetical protein